MARNNFRNHAFRSGPPRLDQFQPGQPPEFIPVVEITIQYNATGQVRINRPASWTDEHFLLALTNAQQVTLEQMIKKNSMLIQVKPDQPGQAPPAIAGEEGDSHVS